MAPGLQAAAVQRAEAWLLSAAGPWWRAGVLVHGGCAGPVHSLRPLELAQHPEGEWRQRGYFALGNPALKEWGGGGRKREGKGRGAVLEGVGPRAQTLLPSEAQGSGERPFAGPFLVAPTVPSPLSLQPRLLWAGAEHREPSSGSSIPGPEALRPRPEGMEGPCSPAHVWGLSCPSRSRGAFAAAGQGTPVRPGPCDRPEGPWRRSGPAGLPVQLAWHVPRKVWGQMLGVAGGDTAPDLPAPSRLQLLPELVPEPGGAPGARGEAAAPRPTAAHPQGGAEAAGH